VRILKLTNNQRKIIVELIEGPKTIEYLEKALDFEVNELTEDIKKILSAGIIKKTNDFPTKYRLDEFISTQLKKRKEIEENDSFRIKIHMIIDIEAITKEIVDLNLKKVKEVLEEDQNLHIHEIKVGEPMTQENYFYGFLDITFTVKNFMYLIHTIMYYAPSVVEVLKPNKLDLSMFELQDGLMEIAQRTSQYVGELQKRLTKEEADLILKKAYNLKHNK